MQQSTVFIRFSFVLALIFTVLGAATNGLPGFVAGVIVGIFAVCGLGGIIAGRGLLGGLGGLFISFIIFVLGMMGLYLFERYAIDGGPIEGKKYGPGGDYLADKVMDILDRWLHGNFHFSGPSIWWPIGICLIGVIFGFIAKATK